MTPTACLSDLNMLRPYFVLCGVCPCTALQSTGGQLPPTVGYSEFAILGHFSSQFVACAVGLGTGHNVQPLP